MKSVEAAGTVPGWLLPSPVPEHPAGGEAELGLHHLVTGAPGSAKGSIQVCTRPRTCPKR